MRMLNLTALALAVALPAAAQQADPDKPAKGGGKLPSGWQARTDKDAALDNVRFESMGPGWHVTTGPAVILWRPDDQAQGDFEASATLIQTKAPEHPEAYGIFVGGQALQGPEQSYTYFLVRGDGKFLIKRRTGATTTNVTEGWTENAAVVKANESGSQQNTLSIQRSGDRVRFLANGTEVLSAPAAEVATGGQAGLRINHNLDVHVGAFTFTKK
ncbi:MAG: hypothetical protein ACREMH_03225 [Gemmatimonadales bacterium]